MNGVNLVLYYIESVVSFHLRIFFLHFQLSKFPVDSSFEKYPVDSSFEISNLTQKGNRKSLSMPFDLLLNLICFFVN